MPSNLRLSTPFQPVAVNATYNATVSSPSKKQKMSLTQTYYVASTARSKLGMEAGRPDHNLRLLVGHANLLDSLMVELADAEREQEAWFNQSVKKASKPEERRHIQWIDTIREEDDEEETEDETDDDVSEAGSDIYDEDEEMFNIPVRNIRRAPIALDAIDDADYDEEYDDEELSLTRTVSNHSPPELTLDSEDSESDDDSMPASPEQPTFELSEKQRQAITTTNFYDSIKSEEQGIEDYLMTSRPQQPMIAAC